MGSPRSEEERDDKEERHEVSITKAFYLGVFELKQSEYDAVAKGEPGLGSGEGDLFGRRDPESALAYPGELPRDLVVHLRRSGRGG